MTDVRTALRTAQRRFAGLPRYIHVIGSVTVVLLAGLWFVTVQQVTGDRKRALDADVVKNANLALAHQLNVSKSLEVLDKALLFLRDHYVTHGKPDDMTERLAALQVDRAYIGIVSVLGAGGEVLASTATGMTNNYADRDYFLAHAADPTDRLIIGKPIQGKFSGKWLISLTRRIKHADGRFAGVVFMAVDPLYFAAEYIHTNGGPRSALALIGLDGITRVRRNNGKISFGEDIRASQLFKEIPKSPVGHYVAVAASDGQTRAAAYHVLQGYPLVALVASSVDDVLAGLQDSERSYYFGAALSSLLLLALAGSLTMTLTNQRRALALVQASEQRYRGLFEHSVDAVLRITAGGVVLAANPAACTLFRMSEDQLKRTPCTQLCEMKDASADVTRMLRKEPGTSHGEMVMIRGDASRFEADVRTSVYSGEHGELIAGAIIRDITERKLTHEALRSSLHEKMALLKEVHHRVKNNLQVIISLLRLETRRSTLPEAVDVLKAMQGRIHAMAQLHQSLYRSGTFASVDLGVYLGQIATQAFQGQRLPEQQVRLQLDLGSVSVGMDQAIACALVVNELVSNSLKHGFPGDRPGEVRVELQPVDPASVQMDAYWRLRVSDTGIGLSSDFDDDNKGSLGLMLARDLGQQVGGTLGIHSLPGAGTESLLIFKILEPAMLVMPA